MATWKDTVRAATTANITLSGTQTLDGVALAVNARVLVKNQTTASQNGLYAVASGAWSRTSDALRTIEPDMAVRVSEGNANAHTAWVLTTQNPITIDTTALTYQQWPCSGFYHFDSSSSALAVGDWVATLPSDPTKITRATPTTALAAGSVLGCVDAAYSAGANNVVVRRIGEVVPASVFSDLGAGGVARLQMNTSGRAVRQRHFSGGEIKLGTIDANGNVTVDTFVPLDRSPQHESTPRPMAPSRTGNSTTISSSMAPTTPQRGTR
jgi:phage-related tail fiber protein